MLLLRLNKLGGNTIMQYRVEIKFADMDMLDIAFFDNYEDAYKLVDNLINQILYDYKSAQLGYYSGTFPNDEEVHLINPQSDSNNNIILGHDYYSRSDFIKVITFRINPKFWVELTRHGEQKPKIEAIAIVDQIAEADRIAEEEAY